jgi:nicotinamidase-related amidase
MKRFKNALFLIDEQFDFCDPKGSLFVNGADKNSIKINRFIERNKFKIDYIGLTMDNHQVNDISHPSFWQDKDGNYPNPFTIISVSDVMSGTWIPRFATNKAIKYIKDLENQGEFPHCIWPEHCIIGSQGASFVEPITNAIKSWCRTNGNFYQVITKGIHPLTEHFGAFRANIPIKGRPETQLNLNLIRTLEKFENIYFAGEAKSHCVANTLKQAMEFPELAKKIIILDDCMSNITGFDHIADNIYSDARSIGVKFENGDGILI